MIFQKKMIKCKHCGKEEDDGCGYTKTFCRDCVPERDREIGVPGIIDKVFIKDYGWTEKSRINELERRVILPDHDPSGGYYVGRRGENGKIQEREPSY